MGGFTLATPPPRHEICSDRAAAERPIGGIEPVMTVEASPQDKIPAPKERDPSWFAPIFVLAPARSNSTIVATMLGMHPQLHGFPELVLFRRNTIAELLVDPPEWTGAPAQLRLAGLLRGLAQVQTGGQTEEAVLAALEWLKARSAWQGAHVLDYMLNEIAPLTGIEKSPENSSHDGYLKRVMSAYPRARFLHLTRHPIPTVASMHKHWSGLGYWRIEPELFHNFCVGVWFHQHRRIHHLIERLPPDRGLQVRSEDILNQPEQALPRICRWLGLDTSPTAIEAMLHPERSPNARVGPPAALGGGDSGFLRDPVRRRTELPESLARPEDWIVDPWQWLAVVELATRLGYGQQQ